MFVINRCSLFVRLPVTDMVFSIMGFARWCVFAAVEQSGLTALCTAAGIGQTDIVRILVEAGANKDLQAKVRLIFPSNLCVHVVCERS